MSGIVNSTGARSGVIGTITAVAGSLGLTTAVGSITANNLLTSAVDQSLSFTPTSVIFFYSTQIDSDAIGMGFCGPTNDNQAIYIKTLQSNPAPAMESTSYAILLQSGGGSSNRATCALGTNKFTLSWTKVGNPASGSNYIKYMAMK